MRLNYCKVLIKQIKSDELKNTLSMVLLKSFVAFLKPLFDAAYCVGSTNAAKKTETSLNAQ